MDYTQLTSIPLFTGISGDDLAMIMDRIEMLDLEIRSGETLIRQGDASQCMTILREGEIQRSRTYLAGSFTNARKETKDLRYSITENIDKSIILEPEVLFGLDLRHRNTWAATTSCKLTMISKEDIRQTLMYVPVWRINFINLLCTNLQKTMDEKWTRPTPNEKERLIGFILRHCTLHGKSMTMHITTEQVGHCIGLDRRMVTKAIEQLEEEGMMKKQKQTIEIPSIQNLRATFQTT